MIILAAIVVGCIGAWGLYELDQDVERHCGECGEDDCGFYLLEGEEDQYH